MIKDDFYCAQRPRPLEVREQERLRGKEIIRNTAANKQNGEKQLWEEGRKDYRCPVELPGKQHVFTFSVTHQNILCLGSLRPFESSYFYKSVHCIIYIHLYSLAVFFFLVFADALTCFLKHHYHLLVCEIMCNSQDC